MDKVDPVAAVLALAIFSTILPSFFEGVRNVIAKWRARKHPEAG
jgi:hypothetical protein